jgi:hypothetical protein
VNVGVELKPELTSGAALVQRRLFFSAHSIALGVRRTLGIPNPEAQQLMFFLSESCHPGAQYLCSFHHHRRRSMDNEPYAGAGSAFDSTLEDPGFLS